MAEAKIRNLQNWYVVEKPIQPKILMWLRTLMNLNSMTTSLQKQSYKNYNINYNYNPTYRSRNLNTR